MNIENTTIICIDLQEKLVNMIKNPSVAQNCEKLLSAASIMDIDTVLTEQYPKGLGQTIEKIKEISNFKILEKTDFSALSALQNKHQIKENVVIFGIETHICVYQTVLDLLKLGKNVYVISNCSSSRDEFNHNTALELMKQKGAYISTLEIVLFEFLKSSKHQNFKEVQALIK